MARIVTLNDLLVGFDDSKFITALKLSQFLNTKVATEAKNGLAKIATWAMVDAGLDNSSIVSPLRLKNRLNQYVNHQEILFIQPGHIGSQVYHTPGRTSVNCFKGKRAHCYF